MNSTEHRKKTYANKEAKNKLMKMVKTVLISFIIISTASLGASTGYIETFADGSYDNTTIPSEQGEITNQDLTAVNKYEFKTQNNDHSTGFVLDNYTDKPEYLVHQFYIDNMADSVFYWNIYTDDTLNDRPIIYQANNPPYLSFYDGSSYVDAFQMPENESAYFYLDLDWQNEEYDVYFKNNLVLESNSMWSSNVNDGVIRSIGISDGGGQSYTGGLCLVDKLSNCPITNTAPEFNYVNSNPSKPEIGEYISYSANVTDYNDNSGLDEIKLEITNGSSTVYNNSKAISGEEDNVEWNDTIKPDGNEEWLNATFTAVDTAGAETTEQLKFEGTAPKISINAPRKEFYPKNDLVYEIGFKNEFNRDTDYDISVDGSTVDSGTTMSSNPIVGTFYQKSSNNIDFKIEATNNLGTETKSINFDVNGTESVENTAVSLNWSHDNTDNVNGFRVYNNLSGSFNQIAETSSNTTEYTDTSSGLTEGEETCYQLTAFNTEGESDPIETCEIP